MSYTSKSPWIIHYDGSSFDEGGRRGKGAAVAYSQDKDLYHCMTAYYKKRHKYERHTARRCPDCDIVIDTE